MSRGILFVMSAPSGTGKSTLTEMLAQRIPDLERSVSYTTRTPRGSERDGVHYHFVSPERFREMRDNGDFLEWAQVFEHFYGTGVGATLAALDAGRDLLLEIDVQGARQVGSGGVPATAIMVLPPDYETLARRLGGRGSESEASLAGRLAAARREVEEFAHFDYVVINDRLEEAAESLCSIVRAERSRTERRRTVVERILATFP